MATTADSAILVDTNVLLTATRPTRRLHGQARMVFEQWPVRGIQLCWSGQVLREYLVVATRPLADNGLGLSVADALVNLDHFHRRCTFLDAPREVSDRLLQMLRRVPCRGKQIHDAHLVATAAHHRVTRLVTENVADFVRFAPDVSVLDLRTVSATP